MADELTPQETERVRRLLADARHTGPIPDDVAARIDRALADAAAETTADAEDAETTSVVPLPERRRNAGRLLLAAAAVVVGGVALGQVVGDVGGSGDTDSAAESSSAGDAEHQLPNPDRDDAVRGNSPGSTAEDGNELPGAVSETRRSISKLPPRQIRSSRFAVDAQRLRPLATGQKSQQAYSDSPGASALSARETCEAGAWGGGRYVRVALGREAGWLVYRAPRGGTQVVDLFLCGEESPERSATLPLP